VPRSTGLPSADARDDFLRARRRGQLARLLGFLRREPDDVNLILPFDEVVRALGQVGRKALGVQTIRLDSIVGTVDRGRDFDRAFHPASATVRARWERVAEARRRGEALPPIDVLRVGEAHFVRDGHHRVSVARALGDTVIDARVTEVLTRVGMDRGVRLGDLPLKSHERLFHERVPLPPEARERIHPSDPENYGDLAEGVEAWGFRLMQYEGGPTLDRPTTAARWYAEEYLASVELLREAGLVRLFATETDAYLQLTCDRYRLLQTQDWTEEAIDRVREDMRE
jgi:hypothetical protein